MSGTYVFAIASAKGGVGKTTTSINLGAALAANGLSVVVVEMDLVMANMVDFIDIDVEPGRTLHDVLSGQADMENAVYDAPGGVDVVPSGTELETYADTRPELLAEVLDGLRPAYDVIILDTGAGVSHETLLPLGLADATILISTPRLASVRDTRKTKNLTERVGGTVAGIVFVKSGTGKAPDAHRIADFLAVDLLGHVPEDGSVPASQDVGLPVTEYDPGSEAARAYGQVAARLSAAIDPDEPGDASDPPADRRSQSSADGDRAPSASDRPAPDPDGSTADSPAGDRPMQPDREAGDGAGPSQPSPEADGQPFFASGGTGEDGPDRPMTEQS